MSTSRIRQGQCNDCKIAWTWSRSVLLRDQVCRCCNGHLKRINPKQVGSAAARAESGFVWMDWDSYSGSQVVPAAREA